jgi:hypothetical protein
MVMLGPEKFVSWKSEIGSARAVAARAKEVAMNAKVFMLM